MLQFRYQPASDDELRTGWDAEMTKLWNRGVVVAGDEPVRVEFDGTEVYDLLPRADFLAWLGTRVEELLT